jgi:hypothetical protein
MPPSVCWQLPSGASRSSCATWSVNFRAYGLPGGTLDDSRVTAESRSVNPYNWHKVHNSG